MLLILCLIQNPSELGVDACPSEESLRLSLPCLRVWICYPLFQCLSCLVLKLLSLLLLFLHAQACFLCLKASCVKWLNRQQTHSSEKTQVEGLKISKKKSSQYPPKNMKELQKTGEVMHKTALKDFKSLAYLKQKWGFAQCCSLTHSRLHFLLLLSLYVRSQLESSSSTLTDWMGKHARVWGKSSVIQ